MIKWNSPVSQTTQASFHAYLAAVRGQTTMELDSLFSVIGECGLYQWFLVILLSLPTFSGAFYSMGYVYLVRTPDYWCKVPYLQSGPLNVSHEGFMNLSIEWEQGTERKIGHSQCYMHQGNFSSSKAEEVIYETQNYTSVLCTQWEYATSEITSSIISQVSTVVL